MDSDVRSSTIGGVEASSASDALRRRPMDRDGPDGSRQNVEEEIHSGIRARIALRNKTVLVATEPVSSGRADREECVGSAEMLPFSNNGQRTSQVTEKKLQNV